MSAEADADDADPVRRRRPLARPPAARSRDAHPGHRAGRQGQRLRLRPRPARRAGPPGSASTPSPSGRTTRCAEVARRASTAPAGAHARGGRSRPRASRSTPRVVHTVGRLEDLARPARPRRAATPGSCSSGSPRCCGTASPPATCARPAELRRRPAAGLEGVALHLPLARARTSAEVQRLMTDVVAAGLPTRTRLRLAT